MIVLCIGAIELSIFSEYYGTELDVVDIQTQRVDRFGKKEMIYESQHCNSFTSRCKFNLGDPNMLTNLSHSHRLL